MKIFFRNTFISIWLIFTMASCSSPKPVPVKEPDYSIISQGQQSGFTIQKALIIENATEFNQLWAIHTGGSKTPTPIIDFKQSVVIANFIGEQHTGGHSITVDKIVNTEKYTQIIFSTHRPTPGSMRTMQITQPYIMIKVTKTKKPIIFEYNRTEDNKEH